MRALTLDQPWATLIAIGAKRVETRSWSTNYRGPLAIHASKNRQFIDMRGKKYLCDQEPFYSTFMKAGFNGNNNTLIGFFPIGCVIAICELVGCHKIDFGDFTFVRKQYQTAFHFWKVDEGERAFGDYAIGRYMWFLDNIKIVDAPIPATGAMGLWEWNPKKVEAA